ncbi:MAG: AraC family transcriptional regulator [Fibrobacteres bacterium]|nr:AraC family transcriptional regulator [Fibrobacterota bacterium]
MFKLFAKDYLKQYPFSLERQRNQLPIGLHTHDFTELVVVLGGQGIHFSRSGEYELRAGDCFVSNRPHGYKEPNHLHLANFLFVPEKLNIPWIEAKKLNGYHLIFDTDKPTKKGGFNNRLRLTTTELSKASGFINKIERLMKLKPSGYEFNSTALFMEFICFLSDVHSQRLTKQLESFQSFSKVINYIERHSAESLKLGDLAEMACMTVGRFIRVFRKTMGHTPIDYIIRQRIQNSCTLLYHSNLTVTNIAYEIGFTDTNYFARQFRRIMQCSPSEFASLNKSNKR